jgi:hypothetical protein
MKKLLLILFAFVPMLSMAQFSEYNVVDSLPLEMVYIHLDKEIEDAIDLGDGYYMVKMPHKDKIVFRTNSDRTKAIMIYHSICFGSKRFLYNIEENENRIVLWYKDSRNYCGYIYDKKYKVCKYFESKREFKRFRRFER